MHVDERSLIVPLAIHIAPPEGDVLIERTLEVPVVSVDASPDGEMVMSSESPSGQVPTLVQPDPRLV